MEPSSCTSSIAPAKAEPVHSSASDGDTPATVFGFDGGGGGGGGAISASIAASIALASRRNAAASARRSSDVAAARNPLLRRVLCGLRAVFCRVSMKAAAKAAIGCMVKLARIALRSL